MKKYSHADKPAAAIKNVAIVMPVFILYPFSCFKQYRHFGYILTWSIMSHVYKYI